MTQQTEQTESLATVDAELVQMGPRPADLIRLALERGTDVAQLERLMDLQLRWEANEARKAFVAALSAFKSNPPRILKDKSVNAGQAKYKHASLANIVREVTPALARHQLSATWCTTQSDDGQLITVSNTITHALGHSETVTLSGPPDKSGAKNAIQMVGSTVTYLSRYTLLANLGLATEDMDDVDQRKAAPMERPKMAIREDVDRLARIAQHRDCPPKIAAWLKERLLKAQRAGGLSAESYAKIAGGLKPELLALAPDDGPDAMPDWGEQPEPPREREPGEEIK